MLLGVTTVSNFAASLATMMSIWVTSNELPVDVVIKRRGPGRDYFTVSYHDSVVSAIAAMNEYNEPVVTRIKGRNNRNVSCPYYYSCVFKACG